MSTRIALSTRAGAGSVEVDAAVPALGILKIGLGWPLQLAALAGMLWLLGRNKTPVQVGTAT